MTVEYTPRLLAVMKEKKKKHISVEVASSPTSDFDYTEIYLRFVDDKTADTLIKKKRYRALETEVGLLLLPPYRLTYGEQIRLDWQRHILFHHIAWEGIKL